MTHDYKRHGTTTLFAALSTLDGSSPPACSGIAIRSSVPRSHRSGDAGGHEMHLIVDNYATHKHPRSEMAQAASALSHAFHPDLGLLAEQGRTVFRLDHDEAIRRGVFNSVPQVKTAIQAYLDLHDHRSPSLDRVVATIISQKGRPRATNDGVRTLGVVATDVLWLDLLNPTSAEVTKVEETVGATLPSLGALSEIETSSRLRNYGGVLYMSTPSAARRPEGPRAPLR